MKPTWTWSLWSVILIGCASAHEVREPAASAATPNARAFLMPIDDVFTISGRGTVVTGKIARGSVAVGEAVEVVGFGATLTSKVTGVEQFRKVTDTAKVSGTVSLPKDPPMVMPGDADVAVGITLTDAVALEVGDTFTLQEGGRTVGTGVIVKAH